MPCQVGPTHVQDLSQLLLDLGIDVSKPDDDHLLPLEIFDDSEFEVRPIDEWISLAEVRDDHTRFSPFPPRAYLLHQHPLFQCAHNPYPLSLHHTQ